MTILFERLLLSFENYLPLLAFFVGLLTEGLPFNLFFVRGHINNAFVTFKFIF